MVFWTAKTAKVLSRGNLSAYSSTCTEYLDLTGKYISAYIIHFTGPPNCRRVHATISTTSLAVSIQKSPMKWLPERYSVEVIKYSGLNAAIVYNATLKGPASLHVASLEPGTVYTISVIPCNMAGCNESCDSYSVQTKSDTARGEMC